MSAGNIIDPHDSLNIPMKHYVFGMRHANLVVKRVHIQTLITSVNFRHTKHVFYAIYFSKLRSPFSSNSDDLSVLSPVESVYKNHTWQIWSLGSPAFHIRWLLLFGTCICRTTWRPNLPNMHWIALIIHFLWEITSSYGKVIFGFTFNIGKIYKLHDWITSM